MFPNDFTWGAATSAYQIEGSPTADGLTGNVLTGLRNIREWLSSICQIVWTIGSPSMNHSALWNLVTRKAFMRRVCAWADDMHLM